jgi:hypothetical protein
MAGIHHSFLLAYRQLMSHWEEAARQRRRARDNPVPLARCLEAGARAEVLHTLLYMGHAEHLLPAPGPHGGTRAVDSVHFREGSSFALTELGQFAGEHVVAGQALDDEDVLHVTTWEELALERLVPRYHPTERVWAWGAHLIKSYSQPAEGQEWILLSAQELGWPEWFDDPLPPRAGKKQKQRLHDTISDLNRRQRSRFIRFRGDGTGQRVGWEFR